MIRHKQLTVDQWHTGTVGTASADASEIMLHELGTANLEALFHNFGRKLIHTVVHSPANDMLDSTALVMGSTMLANVLDAPIPKLTMSKNINFR